MADIPTASPRHPTPNAIIKDHDRKVMPWTIWMIMQRPNKAQKKTLAGTEG